MSELSNCVISKPSLALDNMLINIISQGQDEFTDGKLYGCSYLKYNNSDTWLMNLNSGSIQFPNVNTGKIVNVTSEDYIINENIRVNPLCDFSTGKFNSDKLVGWCGHSKTVVASDGKSGRMFLTTNGLAGANVNGDKRTVIFDAGKAVGTFKNYIETVDCREDIRSGFSVFREYYIDNCSNTITGFPNGLDGLTGEFEIILADDSGHCKVKKNLKTGEMTYYDSSDPVYNLTPSSFKGAVSLGDYIYYIGKDGYIYKINKTTHVQEKRSSSSYGSNYDIFTDGTDVYVSYMYQSSSGHGSYFKLDSDLNTSNTISFNDVNIPNYMKYNYNYTGYLGIKSFDNGTKFLLYSYYYGFALAFSNLSDVAGSVLPEYCQFCIGNGAVSLTSEGLFSMWTGNRPSYNYPMLSYPDQYKLKVCPGTNGQVFFAAEWDEAYENNGGKQVTLTTYGM